MENQSFYFQTIAQKFFKLRGSPFFLSSNELTLIEKWEAAGIPLRVVLEGIESSFLLRRQNHGGTGSRRRIRSLSFCDSFVKQSFTQYKERSVGRRPAQAKKTDKKKDIHIAVAEFLKCVPRQVVWLETPFKQVKEILKDKDCPEEKLERAEENIEALLIAHASPEDREDAKKEAKTIFPDLTEKKDFQRIFHITLIKRMRNQYKIPHVVPFLY